MSTDTKPAETKPPENKPKSRGDLIESSIDRTRANAMTIAGGTVACKDMGDVMEFAKLMSVSGQAIPPHLRGQPGFCLAICIQAMEWRFSPFSVANKSYVVNDRVSYESQLIHAVIEQRAPIIGRLRHSFSGKDSTRRCKVWAFVEGEEGPLEYESPEIQTIKIKNSPLWLSKPDLQLYYNASRDWARVYFPDVILGVYSEDEMEDIKVDKVEAAKRIVARRNEADAEESDFDDAQGNSPQDQ